MRWTRHSPIGIDFGARAIKAVQLAPCGKGWRVSASTIIPLETEAAPPSAALVSELCDTLYRHGFHGRDIVLSAPVHQLQTDLLELPPRSSGAPLEQMARTELARLAKLETEPFEIGCWDLPAPARATGTTMMAVALRHSDADALLDPFEAGGLRVLAIDVADRALARAVSPLLGNITATTAVLDMGWRAARLVLIREGVVIYHRALADCSAAALHKEVMESFECDAELARHLIQSTTLPASSTSNPSAPQPSPIEALLARHVERLSVEIDVSFAYARHRYQNDPIQALLIAGGGAALSGIERYTAELLQVPVAALDFEQLLPGSPAASFSCSTGTFTTALGLALYK